MIEDYILYIFIFFFIVYIVYLLISSRKEKFESSLVASLNDIAQSLDAGNAIETALFRISQDKSNSASYYFSKVIAETKKGSSFQKALEKFSKKSGSRTFSYICDILLLADTAKGNISSRLKTLSENLWELDHLQKDINSKASGPITTLKFLGIVLIPLIYYFLAAVLSSETIVLVISLPFVLYFLAVASLMSFTDTFMFRDIKEGIVALPLAISYIGLVVYKISPLITTFLGL